MLKRGQILAVFILVVFASIFSGCVEKEVKADIGEPENEDSSFSFEDFESEVFIEEVNPDQKNIKIENIKVVQVGEDFAILSWETESPSDSKIKYGIDNFEQDREVIIDEIKKIHEISLIGLDPGKTYFFKIEGNNQGGHFYFSDIKNFTTSYPPLPVITEIQWREGYDNVNIIWTTDRPSTSIVAYGKKSEDFSDKFEGSLELVSYHNITLTNLLPMTTYIFKIGGEDVFAREFFGSEETFATKIGGFNVPIRKGDVEIELLSFGRETENFDLTKIEVKIRNYGEDKLKFKINSAFVDYYEGTQYNSVDKNGDLSDGEIYPNAWRIGPLYYEWITIGSEGLLLHLTVQDLNKKTDSDFHFFIPRKYLW